MKQTLLSKKRFFYVLAIILISFSSCENKTSKTSSTEKGKPEVPKLDSTATKKEVEKPNEQSVETEEEKPVEESTYKGTATYYNDRYHGKKTASGELYDKNLYTAAIRMNAIPLPFGTIVEVYSKKRKKKVRVKINDKMSDRASAIIDLSIIAAKEIGLDIDGRTKVTVQKVSDDSEIGVPPK